VGTIAVLCKILYLWRWCCTDKNSRKDKKW